jgi:hypothetical protein
MERQVVASAQEISSGMPEFSIQRSAGEPQGTAGAKATQRHPQATSKPSTWEEIATPKSPRGEARTQSAECRKAGQSHSKVGFGGTRSAARQSRNQSQEGLAAEHVHLPQRCYGGRAENSENRLPPASPSAYSAYSAVYLFAGESSPPANNLDYCSGVQNWRLRAPVDQRSAVHLNRSAAETPQESGLDKLG